MKFTKFLYLIPFSVIMSGCVPSQNFIGGKVEETPLSDRAYIIGKYTVQCDSSLQDCYQGFNSISISYQDMPEKQYYGVISSTTGSAFFGKDTEYDFVSPETNEKGVYFCEALPPGNYSFYNFDYYNFAGGGSGYSLNESGQFDIPFKLKKGEVAYIGQLKMTTSTGENLFGMKVYGPGVVQLSTNPEKDIELALQKCPAVVQHEDVVNKSLKADIADTPFVEYKKAS